MKGLFAAATFWVALVLAFGLADWTRAQTFTVLHTFTSNGDKGPNSDGVVPIAGLLLSSNTLYGTAAGGGSSGRGTVFALNTDGTGYTVLHSFNGADGGTPYADLILSGNTLYGTTEIASQGWGSVFAVNTDGTGFTNLHSFNASDGYSPMAGLTLSSDILYGTTSLGGTSPSGTIFKINIDGTGFSTLHNFSALDSSFVNSDGEYPESTLIFLSNRVYGTAVLGGLYRCGTVFRVNIDGMDFRSLHHFANYDGTRPHSLLLSDGALYGTTQEGGNGGSGTVFTLNIDGTGFRTLYSLEAASGFSSVTNSEGADPNSLILSGNTLYGTTYLGGNSGNGTVFALNTSGPGLIVLYSFTATYTNPIGPYTFTNSDGASPKGGLIVSSNTLYGTTSRGGGAGNGTIFSISFTPRLEISISDTNLVLSWPSSYAGFDYIGYTLQFATNLASPIWTTNLPAPVVVNGQNVVTNPISGTQQFFRLSQ
jgi:uncharacterized repeat protein (TIGR03803 family)